MSADQVQNNDSTPTTVGELLKHHASRSPNLPAFSFEHEGALQESVTFQQLWKRAQKVADLLQELGPAGSRALLLYPPGIEFLVGFCGCSIAGWTPVTTCFPKPARAMSRLDSIAGCCQPSVLLSDTATLSSADPTRWSDAAAAPPRIATNDLEHLSLGSIRDSIGADKPVVEDIGLLQFTSGSTDQPKGVMVRNAQLLANLEAIRVGFGIDAFDAERDQRQLVSVFWLPAFHDMGLIGGLLTPLYTGSHSIIMSPRDFLVRPVRWLEAISRHRANVTGAPNFAYQLCVDRIDGPDLESVDLSSLSIAFCGAEPIQARTLEQFSSRFAHTGFKQSALMPCYGLAESTLYVAGSRPGSPRTVLTIERDSLEPANTVHIVSSKPELQSGRSSSPNLQTIRCVTSGEVAEHTEIAIVHPDSRQRLNEDQVGEIWVRGSSVADGYWPGSTASPDTAADGPFHACLADAPDACSFLRTGDLGFLHEGQLFVTGRIKDLIILRGRNHYPQDIESTVLRVTENQVVQAAAFSVESPVGESLAVVSETDRHTAPELLPAIARDIRRSIIESHEIDPRHILLVRPASIPVTTSGKVQRFACRKRFETGQWSVRHRWDRNDLRTDGMPVPVPQLPQRIAAEDQPEITRKIEAWLIQWLALKTGTDATQISPHASMDELGLDSFISVEMSGEIEDWLGVRLTPEVAFEYPSPDKLAGYLAARLVEQD